MRKEPNLRFKYAPLIAASIAPSTATSNAAFSSLFFAIFRAFQSEILGVFSSAT